MSIDVLGNLFGSINRVKLLRLFLFNEMEQYEKEQIVSFTKVPSGKIVKELNTLIKVGIIKKTSFFKEIENKKTGKISKKRTQGYVANPKFMYFRSLQSLLIKSAPVDENGIGKRIKKVGSVKAIIVSGLFIQDPDSVVDLLVIGDRIKMSVLRNTIATIESEIGKPLRYTIFSTSDFKYRLTMYDRLVRDILDYPHVIIMDSIGIENL
jgi:hypothetical protein